MDSDFLVEYVHGRHAVRDYFDRFLGDRSFEAALAGYPELRSRCADHLWSAFSELDMVPRSDPFWAESNMRTTFSKVREFYAKRVAIEDADVESCWRSFAIAVCHGDLDRFSRASEVLLRASQLSVPEFLQVALNLVSVSGWETHDLAAEILLRLNLTDVARGTLDSFIRSAEPFETEWAGKVLGRVERAG